MENKKTKPGAPRGNKNAAKAKKLDGILHLQCFRSEKGRWNQAAQSAGYKNLSTAIRTELNKWANNPHKTDPFAGIM